ncbi:hypothetical protein [Thauera sp. SDU_THAU2]|uniref:hypothetical protein n=1 Tax=Thauera sp. SDU_THAU2 TaxID=3136633 RepID=UPI00311F93BD
MESNKVRATYNKALLLDQRRMLLQDWADYPAERLIYLANGPAMAKCLFRIGDEIVAPPPLGQEWCRCIVNLRRLY